MAKASTEPAPNKGSTSTGSIGASAPGEGLALLEARLSEAAADPREGVGFDPTVIIGIITAIIALFGDCPNAQPRALRRRFLNRARVAAALRKTVPGLSWVESMRRAEQLFDLADRAKDEELQALIDDCCR